MEGGGTTHAQTSILQYEKALLKESKRRFYMARDCEVLLVDAFKEVLKLSPSYATILREWKTLDGGKHLYISGNENMRAHTLL